MYRQAARWKKYAPYVVVVIAGCLPCLPVSTNTNESPYFLPYPAGTTAWVGQGFEGVFEPHRAYDFVLPEGSLVLAARAGVVTAAVDRHEGNCPFTQDCDNNYVYIGHGDGTDIDPFVETGYLHIQKGSALVRPGDVVEQGQPIARVGNVGISLMPHIHFSLFIRGEPNLHTQFADVSCDNGYPQYFRTYTSHNTVKAD